ncbi:MAG: flavin reductase family protein [Myxococcota bacterium]
MEVDPKQLSLSETYKILSGCVTPRPVAFVSSCSPEGYPNLAPFSFFNGISANPMAVAFSPLTAPDGVEKDTLQNVLPEEEGGTGEFVVNLASEAYIREVSAAAERLPRSESEFDLTKLEMASSRLVRPARVARSPVAFECRTLQVVRINRGAPMAGNLVIGEVVHVYLRDDITDAEFHIDQMKIANVGRMGGPLYCRTLDAFPLERGIAALEATLPFTPRE